jgi:tetratricopeptide (TPR) repeat protein
LTRYSLLGLLIALTFAGAADAKPTKEQARAVYAKGKAAYERGDYGEALVQFEEAYRLSSTPALLFNMAQAHRLSGPDHCQQALDLYRRYLAEDPNAKNRGEAAERIDEMQECAARSEEAGESATPPPEPEQAPPRAAAAPVPSARTKIAPAPASKPVRAPRDQTPDRARPTAAIVVTGVSVALGVAGVILYSRASAKYDEVERSCPCPPGSFSNWETLTAVSYGLMAAGAVGTAGGISWYLLGGENAQSAPHGAFVTGAVRF